MFNFDAPKSRQKLAWNKRRIVGQKPPLNAPDLVGNYLPGAAIGPERSKTLEL